MGHAVKETDNMEKIKTLIKIFVILLLSLKGLNINFKTFSNFCCVFTPSICNFLKELKGSENLLIFACPPKSKDHEV